MWPEVPSFQDVLIERFHCIGLNSITKLFVFYVFCFCYFLQKKDDDDSGGHQQVPRVFVTFKGAHTYQLRAYIYQARDMYGSDKSGLSGMCIRQQQLSRVLLTVILRVHKHQYPQTHAPFYTHNHSTDPYFILSFHIPQTHTPHNYFVHVL